MPVGLKPFFTYFGGKYRIAPKYPKPRYLDLIEPFAGSAGYAVRYPHRRVHLYDLNPKVIGTWQYLIRSSEKDILSLPLVFDDVRDTGICQEAQWLIGWWLNKGTTAPCNVLSKWMRDSLVKSMKGNPHLTFWGDRIRERIASQLHSIRHWKAEVTSYESIPNIKASYFIDPPYHKSGKIYTHSTIDYDHLAEWSKSRKGQVIVCEQEGANWLPFKPFLECRGTQGYKMPGTSKEVIYEVWN